MTICIVREFLGCRISIPNNVVVYNSNDFSPFVLNAFVCCMQDTDNASCGTFSIFPAVTH